MTDDHGAHGVFDDRAAARCPQLWMTTHRAPVALSVAVAGAALLLGALGRRRKA